MTRDQIESRIEMMMERLTKVTHSDDIRATNEIIEKLIMMDADDERPFLPTLEKQ